SHAGQNGDVNFRVTEEPEEMLPQQSRSAAALDWLSADDQPRRNEETGSGIAVQKKKNHRNQQNTEGEQAEDCGHKPCPAGKRHWHQVHSGGAKLDGGGNEIDCAENGGDTEQANAGEPQVSSKTLTWSGRSDGAEWSILRPASQGCATGNEESRN